LAGAAAAAGVSVGVEREEKPPSTGAPVDFYGSHQAGIVTPAQDRLHFASFDLLEGTSKGDLVAMLQEWTSAAAAMCAGRAIGGTTGMTDVEIPPEDSGEAVGLQPARLSITIGFGPTLFEPDGTDRFGVAARRPAALEPLPRFAGDALDPARSDGDIAIQACSDDPQVAVHAVRNLARIAQGTLLVRYSQLGFGRTSSTSTTQATPRNLMGFKDGTANLKAEDTDAVDANVWVGADDEQGRGAPWMTGGSYLVTRRIRMNIETWDRDPLFDQEDVIGRQKLSGAPLGGAAEFDQPDLKGIGVDGRLIPPHAHVRLSHPSSNGSARILRRGYSFVDGSDDLGRLEAGLFFMAYQRDPSKQFTRIQQTLSQGDALNEYISHVGSGLFAVPPGVKGDGDWWGSELFS
jgi:deferrochelatase/peroxidase EfeB